MSRLTWHPGELAKALADLAMVKETNRQGLAWCVRLHPATIVAIRTMDYWKAPRIPIDADPEAPIPMPAVMPLIEGAGPYTIMGDWVLIPDVDLKPGHWRIEVMGVLGQMAVPE